MFDFIKENPILCLILFLLVVSPSFLFGAVQVLAVIFLVVVILIIVGVLSLKWRIGKLQKQQQEQGFGQQQGQQGQQQFRDNNASSYSAPSGGREKRVADDVGDYVDFEEIKEE